MTSPEATRVVLISMGVLAAITISAHRDNANPDARYKSLWAIGALGLGLAALADVAPQVAGPFALLTAVAMVSRNPGELGRALGFGPGGLAPGSTRGYGALGPRPEEGSAGRRAGTSQQSTRRGGR